MKALILSGGKGTRLQPITNTSPKQLVPVANKPVLFYVIEMIVAAGISDIGIIVGDTCEEIKLAVKDGKQFGSDVSITYIHQKYPLGLAHAVKIARPFLGEERFLMMLGDNFIEENISQQVQRFFQSACPYHAQVFLKHFPDPEQFGVAQLCTLDGQPLTCASNVCDDTIRIARLVEKPREFISHFALVGIYLFDPHVFEAIESIKPSPRGELEITDAIQNLVDCDYFVRPHILTGYWIDTGQIHDMLNANRAVLSQMKRSISSSARIDEASEVYGEVILEENVHLVNSVVRGPSIIGRNVTLSNAYIGPFTSIDHDGFVENSEIEHSIILEGCSIQDVERRIEDSLIGRRTHIYASPAKPRAYKFLLGDNSRLGIL